MAKSEISNLAIFCDCKAQFLWDLLGNPNDRFSSDKPIFCYMTYLCQLFISQFAVTTNLDYCHLYNINPIIGWLW